MPEHVPGKYYVVRKQGRTVARYIAEGDYIDPAITEHEAFSIQTVPDRAALRGQDIDRSVLTEEEYDILGLPPEPDS